ncbi:MAG: ABC transporter permease [Myxococcales bacterium]|nr:MAG: ABC transporter permease [Myxococcales bacterium]
MSFRAYLFRRIAITVPTVLGVATLVFALIHWTPGDPVDVMLGESATPAARDDLRVALGLDRPVAVQYAAFLAGLARGDLGVSIQTREPVADLVGSHLPNTLMLAAAAFAFSVSVSIPLGLLAAARPRGWIDRFSAVFSLAGLAIPNFWLGPILVLCFSIYFGLLPVSGSDTPSHVILPAITLGLAMTAFLTRMTRSAVLESLSEDYIRTARAIGASESRIVARHAFANALTPIISVLGLQAGSLLAGSVITETIFAWPGLGRLTVEAIRARDYPLVQGCVLVIALAYVFANLVTDLSYAFADPRTRVDPDDVE